MWTDPRGLSTIERRVQNLATPDSVSRQFKFQLVKKRSLATPARLVDIKLRVGTLQEDSPPPAGGKGGERERKSTVLTTIFSASVSMSAVRLWSTKVLLVMTTRSKRPFTGTPVSSLGGGCHLQQRKPISLAANVSWSLPHDLRMGLNGQSRAFS